MLSTRGLGVDVCEETRNGHSHPAPGQLWNCWAVQTPELTNIQRVLVGYVQSTVTSSVPGDGVVKVIVRKYVNLSSGPEIVRVPLVTRLRTGAGIGVGVGWVVTLSLPPQPGNARIPQMPIGPNSRRAIRIASSILAV